MKKDMKGNGNMMCSAGTCPKCHGGMWLVAGLLLLGNALWGLFSFEVMVGLLLAVAGLLKLLKPKCPHCC